MTSWARRGSQVVAWSVLLVTTVTLSLGVLVPRVTGATPYAVLTGSMRPDYPPGTLVVVKPVTAEDVTVGDVITYQLESGEREVVTHRVVSVEVDGDGQRVFQTQGDANDSADERPVRPVQVRGRLWYSVPYLGYANELLTGAQREWIVYWFAALLVGYAVLTWVSAVRDRSRRRREVSDAAEWPHSPTPA